ncbi:hypothetical protein TNCV_1537371 [Trichonephila clavipes]|nr:hypothetical protein TNCV_1537371 [Trichonephila clavipes]
MEAITSLFRYHGHTTPLPVIRRIGERTIPYICDDRVSSCLILSATALWIVSFVRDGTEGREQLEAMFEVDHTSPFIQPASINKRYLYAPYKERKPCIWLKGMWPDERRRMFVCNILSKVAHQLSIVCYVSSLLVHYVPRRYSTHKRMIPKLRFKGKSTFDLPLSSQQRKDRCSSHTNLRLQSPPDEGRQGPMAD